jgi:hypothetical protein
MPGVQKKYLSTPELTRHRAHAHARECRRMLLDLKTSRRHATNGLFGVSLSAVAIGLLRTLTP